MKKATIELSFKEGKFVSGIGSLNYQRVVDDFPTASIIRIITYNLSKNIKYDALMDAVMKSPAEAEIITNIPSRMDQYYNSYAGEAMRRSAGNNIRIYASKLDPNNFPGVFKAYFNSNNHAKIIGTENIVYIGSANYSNESAGNWESGVIIEDKEFIGKLYEEFFEGLRDSDDTVPFYNESLTAFQVFLMSLSAKFDRHYHKFVGEVIGADNAPLKWLTAPSFLDTSDLEALYYDLFELESVCDMADDTYDEKNEKYNSELEEVKDLFEHLSIDWLKETIEEDSPFYRMVAYDPSYEANRILQERYSAEAWDEQLDYYMEKSMDEASEIYDSMQAELEVDSGYIVLELEKIIDALNEAIAFTHKWKSYNIDHSIDNT